MGIVASIESIASFIRSGINGNKKPIVQEESTTVQQTSLLL